MHAQTLIQVRAEREQLRRQCMVGYVTFHPCHSWDGHLYHRLHRAQAALAAQPAGSEIVLVHTSGALYYQSAGERIGIVLSAGGKNHHVQLARRARKRIVRAHRNQACHRPSRVTGYRHPGYID